MIRISIIVPVYKAENCLHRCIEGILAQSFSDFELILVDDGSPDSSGSICDTYAARDNRIQVIHQVNQGAASARNAGLDAATGEYIAFCDSDDLVSPKWLEHMLHYAAPDVLPMCSYCSESADLGKQKPLSGISPGLHAVTDYFLFNQRGLAGYLCNALYRNEVIQAHGLRLRTWHEKGDYNEDLLFALQYARHVKHIVYTGYSDYFYDSHQGSLSTSYHKLYFDKYEEKYRLWHSFLIENQKESLLKELSTSMVYHFLSALNGETISGFHRIIHTDSVQECIASADTSAENPAIIRLILKKAVFRLWLLYQIHTLKGRLQ